MSRIQIPSQAKDLNLSTTVADYGVFMVCAMMSGVISVVTKLSIIHLYGRSDLWSVMDS